MPPDPSHRAAARRLAVAAALLAALPLAACDAPPAGGAAAPVTSPGVGGPPTRGVLPGGVPTAVPPVTATPGFPPGTTPTPTTPLVPPGPTPAAVATACAGRPSADRVVGLLRDRVLPAGVRVRATTGPLCADGWQYTVLAVTGHEALQVVTRGEPGALRLVTAGTDVCSIEVRAAAPPAIRTSACDAGPGALPGP
ncbi:hypothetical protein GA0070614_3140 [Micromonospora coxensis]|uniref:Uncharacterized protein n=1 Tax=Micromonospora coxensis TaxID=356852 RepID=A0A1C5INT7_9ACTN|nr:hypothetical protein [Micromonospora coxensis]SCG60017.1 hypothetical protein GA0070614_3140 [Micromonospora coxensis]